VDAGRRAYLSGKPPELEAAEPSSPLTGFLDRLITSQADPGVTEP
jgi:thiazole synthase ThiGH ThiG subunit